jgi:hypothetical protein
MYYLVLIVSFVLFRLFLAYKINVNISAFIMSLLLITLCIKFCLSYFNLMFDFDFLDFKEHYIFILLTIIPTFLFCFFMIKLGLREEEL